jgi:hypothetical protein
VDHAIWRLAAGPAGRTFAPHDAPRARGEKSIAAYDKVDHALAEMDEGLTEVDQRLRRLDEAPH